MMEKKVEIYALQDHCEEAPVDLIVNGRKVTTFMCTPEDTKLLAIGYLYSRGLINSIEDIRDIGACGDIRKVIATTKELLVTDKIRQAADFIEDEERVTSNLSMNLSRIKQLAIKMFFATPEAGNMHSAALADHEDLMIQKEDVGRHNAIDKAIGGALMGGYDLTESILITTAKVSSDMILKAVVCKIPVVVTRSIPSSLAIEIAEALGITIIGRIAAKDPVVITHPDRIKL